MLWCAFINIAYLCVCVCVFTYTCVCDEISYQYWTCNLKEVELNGDRDETHLKTSQGEWSIKQNKTQHNRINTVPADFEYSLLRNARYRSLLIFCMSTLLSPSANLQQVRKSDWSNPNCVQFMKYSTSIQFYFISIQFNSIQIQFNLIYVMWYCAEVSGAQRDQIIVQVMELNEM